MKNLSWMFQNHRSKLSWIILAHRQQEGSEVRPSAVWVKLSRCGGTGRTASGPGLHPGSAQECDRTTTEAFLQKSSPEEENPTIQIRWKLFKFFNLIQTILKRSEPGVLFSRAGWFCLQRECLISKQLVSGFMVLDPQNRAEPRWNGTPWKPAVHFRTNRTTISMAPEQERSGLFVPMFDLSVWEGSAEGPVQFHCSCRVGWNKPRKSWNYSEPGGFTSEHFPNHILFFMYIFI